MKNLQLPVSCAFLSEEEQRAVSGGGELLDAVGDFIRNIQWGDFFLGGTFVALSFTFVPNLLFDVFKACFNLAKTVYNNTTSLSEFLFGTSAQSASSNSSNS